MCFVLFACLFVLTVFFLCLVCVMREFDMLLIKGKVLTYLLS